jgi:Polyketide cyclase / dehydrase and lipid transport
MREVVVSKIISADREAIFDFVCDLAGRPAFADHYLHDYRLARANPVGEGAAARFQLRAPLAKEYAELEVREVDRPRRIVEELAVGRRGRNRFIAVYDFTQEAAGLTRVELTTYGEPATLVDRLKQVGAASWIRRQTAKQLERLRTIFEESSNQPLRRATIAGYEPQKAPRFGASAGFDPARVPRD